MAETTEREHSYYAQATVLNADLQIPVFRAIEPLGLVMLSEKGGYLTKQSGEYRLESIITFASSYTQVAGNADTKPGHGYSTLVTSVVEGLNILDVLTCDRVVSQVSTEHPLNGYVPSVSFLGTRFDNLRIAGHPVEIDLDLHFCGSKPAEDAAYTQDPAFVGRVTEQHAALRSHSNPISGLIERYNRVPESFVDPSGTEESVECSLVDKVQGKYPGRTCGHVVDIPNFGIVHLADLQILHSDYKPGTRIPKLTTFELTMIKAKLGCIASGSVGAASSRVGGTTHP